MNLTDYHVFPGSELDITEEEVLAEVEKVIQRIAVGDFDEMSLD